MKKPDLVPLTNFAALPQEEMLQRSRQFYTELARRRTVREFSDRAVPRSLIENCLRAAGTAPSGANMQPWQFVAISDKAIKRKIRVAAEDEERHFYAHRASPEWLQALAPLGTDSNKPFLDIAPWLIAVFYQKFGRLPDGTKVKHYYPVESVGLATGILITALHHAGLATLTHTPSPMKFMNKILDRPDHERPFLLLVAGFPAEGCRVPNIGRKSLEEFASFIPAQERD